MFSKVCCAPKMSVSISSDEVLEADVSPQGCLEAEHFDVSASCQLPAASSVFHWLVSASETLPLPRLGLDLTASASPWLIGLMGKPHKTQSGGLGSAKTNPIT